MNEELANIEALTFDMFGTVTDWRSTIIHAGAEIERVHGPGVDWNRFALAWRAGYAPAMQRVRSGELPWTTIDDLHRMILDEILEQFGIEYMTEEEKRHLNKVWHRLEPWPDARTGLERLREKFTTATLSNGNMALLTNMTKHADLRFDCILSAELASCYKPDADVYRTAARYLSLQPEQVLMVAAHNNDLEGARTAGLRTAFVARPEEYGAEQTTDSEPASFVDVAAEDFHTLADRLDC